MINYYDQKRFEIYEEWGKQYPEASLPSNLQAPSSTTAPNPDATLQKPPTVLTSPPEPDPTTQSAPHESTKEVTPPPETPPQGVPDSAPPSPAPKSTTPSGPQPTPQPVAREPPKETPAPVTLQGAKTVPSTSPELVSGQPKAPIKTVNEKPVEPLKVSPDEAF